MCKKQQKTACVGEGEGWQFPQVSPFLLKYNCKHLKCCLYFNSPSIMGPNREHLSTRPMVTPFYLEETPMFISLWPTTAHTALCCLFPFSGEEVSSLHGLKLSLAEDDLKLLNPLLLSPSTGFKAWDYVALGSNPGSCWCQANTKQLSFTPDPTCIPKAKGLPCLCCWPFSALTL